MMREHLHKFHLAASVIHRKAYHAGQGDYHEGLSDMHAGAAAATATAPIEGELPQSPSGPKATEIDDLRKALLGSLS